MGAISFVDWAIFAAYVVLVFGLAIWFARQQQTNEDFFVGARKMSWVPVGLSMFASILSSISFIGMPTQASGGNLSRLSGCPLHSTPDCAYRGLAVRALFPRTARDQRI